MKEIVKKVFKIISVILILIGLIFAYFAIPNDGLNRMFDFLKSLLKFVFYIGIFSLFVYIILFFIKLIKKFVDLKKGNEKLNLKNKDLEDKIRKLKNTNENLIIENKNLKNDFNCNDLEKNWKKAFEEFKTLTFFDKFENIIKWVKNDQDYYSLYGNHINYSALFDYCFNEEIIIKQIENISGNQSPILNKKIRIEFTGKGRFFAKEFLKEKHKIIPEIKKPNIIKVINYG